MEQQISNKVYESLQVPTEHVRTTTGKYSMLTVTVE